MCVHVWVSERGSEIRACAGRNVWSEDRGGVLLLFRTTVVTTAAVKRGRILQAHLEK